MELSRGDQILCNFLTLSSIQNSPLYESERIALGEKILAKNYAPLAQEYLKRGCPKSIRSKMWSLLLGSEVKQMVTYPKYLDIHLFYTFSKFLQHYNYFQSLKDHVLQFDLMIDKLIIKDINLTASNDDQYFVFEDVLYQVPLLRIK